ncbi:MAG TPA: hypothetical protein VG013_10415 [Gemmataceae bacterium]|jgi:hypothetical protein|nr:hypothetical protein [Gemmataceae bacterium]
MMRDSSASIRTKWLVAIVLLTVLAAQLTAAVQKVHRAFTEMGGSPRHSQVHLPPAGRQASFSPPAALHRRERVVP